MGFSRKGDRFLVVSALFPHWVFNEAAHGLGNRDM